MHRVRIVILFLLVDRAHECVTALCSLPTSSNCTIFVLGLNSIMFTLEKMNVTKLSKVCELMNVLTVVIVLINLWNGKPQPNFPDTSQASAVKI